jgi:deazaflavin-dependent oxidoreductase (nitroreductase family)
VPPQASGAGREILGDIFLGADSARLPRESGTIRSMPLSRSVARFNRRATNRLLGPLVPYLPTFCFVIHTGRKTGRQYRTPVNAFRRAGGYMIGLPYGRDSDWVLNVLAAGGCMLEMHGRRMQLTQPRVVRARNGVRAMPAPLRLIGRLGFVSHFLDLSLDDEKGLQKVLEGD